MPLYEYRCETCGENEEKLEHFDAPMAHDCAKCGAAAGMQRQISQTSFTLAGKGAGSAPAASPAPAKPSAPAGGCAGGCACHSGKA
jgi:putative FmdB family regulatory protein